MLAYWFEWHMRRAWAPLLFAEDDPEDAARRRASPVRPSVPADSAEHKATTKRTTHGHPVRNRPDLERLDASSAVGEQVFLAVSALAHFERRHLVEPNSRKGT